MVWGCGRAVFPAFLVIALRAAPLPETDTLPRALDALPAAIALVAVNANAATVINITSLLFILFSSLALFYPP
jgi:hypothetical protein